MGVLALALGAGSALAGPDKPSIAAAAFEPIATRSHKAAGEVRISRAQVGDLPCFRGEATVASLDPAALLAVLLDVEAAPSWSTAGITEAATLDRSGTSIDFYEYLDIPGWTLVADRFWFARATWETTPGRAVFWWDRLEGGGPHAARFADVQSRHPGAVEPPVNIGYWSFEQRAEQTSVTYTVCTDPGGSLPQAIQNLATKRTLPDTVAELIQETRRRVGGGDP